MRTKQAAKKSTKSKMLRITSANRRKMRNAGIKNLRMALKKIGACVGVAVCFTSAFAVRLGVSEPVRDMGALGTNVMQAVGDGIKRKKDADEIAPLGNALRDHGR